jgi:pyruvate dehydrogenase E1 component alpha subunit
VDAAAYRAQSEVDGALESDPLKLAAASLVALGVAAVRIAQIDAEAHSEIEAALAAARTAPWPRDDAAYTDVQDTGAGQWH